MDKTKLENLTQGISPKDILRLQDIARDTIKQYSEAEHHRPSIVVLSSRNKEGLFVRELLFEMARERGLHPTVFLHSSDYKPNGEYCLWLDKIFDAPRKSAESEESRPHPFYGE